MFIRLLISPATAAVRRGLTMSIGGLVTLGTISSGSALISMSRLIFRADFTDKCTSARPSFFKFNQ